MPASLAPFRIESLLFLFPPRLFERHVILKLLAQSLQFFLCGVFKLLQAFRVSFFNFSRQPKALGKIKSGNTDDHNNQQHFAQALEVADKAHDCATEEITGAAKQKY